MIKKTKLMLALAFILVMSSVLLITASAESLWDAKPTTAPVDYGYCLDWDGSKAVDTNIKWEIHNLGAADAPSYAIYYYIDDTVDSDNKLLSSQMNKEASVTADNNSYGYNSTAQEIYSKHPWYNAENPDIFKNIKTIVIGDNIEGFKNGAFAAMYTVTTIEMPASLVSMDGAAFKNMTALSSVYTRGVNEAETGVINLSNLTSINMNINYIFCGLKQATKYVWNENLTLTSTATKNSIGWQGFCNNTKLTSIDLPDVESLTSVGSYTFQGCSVLKEITIPGSYTTINANVFSNCTVLEKINCEIGTAAFNFAEQYGYLPPLIELIPEATEATPTGYCLDWVSSAATPTNVKWELHNLGTADAPNYTLYFYIDKSVDSTNTLLSSQMNKDLNATNNVNGYGYGNEGVSVYSKHPWYDENTISLIKNIVIADGITGLKNGAFAGMTSVEKVEMPKTLTTINGAVFKGMTNLSSVYTRGVNEAEEGIINLENITEINFGGINYGFRGLAKVKQYIFNENVKDEGYTNKRISQAFFAGNTSLTSIDLSGVTNLETIRTQAFLNCSSLTEIRVSSTITSIQKDDAFSGCTSLKEIYAPVGSVVHSYAMAKGYETTHTIDVYGTVDSVENVHCATLTFDPQEKHATAVKVLESGWWEFDPYENADIRSFMNAYKDYAVSFTFEDNFSKIRSYYGIFNGFTKLESVCFAAGQRLVDWWGNGGIFSGCTALTTVYFGDETEIKAGIADFSGMGIWAEDKPAIFTKALFQNCTSLTEVIFPSLNNTGYTNSSGTYVENDPIIYTTTFEGCTALRSLTVPSTFDAIESGAFSTCASLTTLNYSASIDLITGDTVTGTIGLVIYCDSEEYAKEVNAALKTADVPTSQAFAFYMPGMKSELYYSVRDKIKVTENDDGTTNTVNNGLRTIFSFNETAPEGYTLVEYGSLSATKDTWSGYTENFGGEESVLQLSENGEFITPSKIVKTPIYNLDSGYVNNSDKSDETAVSFAVTIVNFDSVDEYKAEIVAAGYEIWKDADGNYYVIYTRDKIYGYDTSSLYKITVGMLTDENSGITLEKSDNPLWNVLKDCTTSEISLDNTAVTGFMLPDPLNDSKSIALYVTDSETEVELKYLGYDFSERNTVSGKIFGNNVKYSLPRIDDYWEEHITEKLDSLPEGKSFIAITDMHFESDGDRNTRKSTAMIEYIRRQTGIKNVVNLGDPYSGEATIDGANTIFETALETYFYDVFGEDGIFVVGNHDGNYTTWSGRVSDGAEEGVGGEGAYNYLLPDTAIYNATIAHIAEREGVVFNDVMVEMADQLDFSPINYEDSVQGVSYTEEQLKEEFIAWVYQHYYYDDAENGIRYIVYNAGNCGITEYYTLGKTLWDVDAAQLDFIYKALSTTPESYDVVFCGHMLASTSEYSTDDSRIYKILSAFKGGYSVTINVDVSEKNDNMKTIIGNKEKTFDFTESNFTGTIFTIGGHWHCESSFVWQTEGVNYRTNLPYDVDTETTDDAVFYIGLNNDCFGANTNNSSDPIPVKGTLTENCFYIITITEEGNVVVTGIGAGTTRNFNYN